MTMIHADSKLRVIVPALVAIQVVLFYVRVQKSSLFSDDFLNFELYREHGFTLRYLLLSVFGQMAPGFRAVQAFVLEVFGPSYAATATIIGVLSVASTCLLAGIASRLGAAPWAIGAGLLIFIGLPQYAQAQQWWAAAVHTIFSITAILAAGYCLAGSSRWRVAIATVWYAVGLTFTGKVICAPIMFAAIVLFRELQARNDLRASIRTTLMSLLPFAVLSVAYLVAYSLTGPYGATPRPSGGVLTRFVWEHVSSGVIASSLGADGLGLDLPRWIPTAALVALAVVTSWMHPQVTVLWVGALVYAVAAGALIGFNRAGLIPQGGGTPRYCVEEATLLMLAVSVAISIPFATRRTQIAAVIAGLLVLVNVQAHLGSRFLTPYPIDETRSYVRQLRASLRELGNRGDVVVLQGNVPDFVVPAWIKPYDEISRFIPIFNPRIKTGDAASATHELGSDGTLRPRSNASHSAAAGAVQPTTAPVVPFTRATPATISATTPGDGRVTVAWNAPASNGGAAIRGYAVHYAVAPAAGQQPVWKEWGRVNATARSAVVTGLVNGTGYLFRVSAINAAGYGAVQPTTSAVAPRAS